MGKIHAKWKEAKAALSKEVVAALPKADFGGQLDTFEALSDKLSKDAAALAAGLDDWYKQYYWLQNDIFPAYVRKIPAKEKNAHALIGDMLRLIRGSGAKTHGEWAKLKDAKIGTLKF